MLIKKVLLILITAIFLSGCSNVSQTKETISTASKDKPSVYSTEVSAVKPLISSTPSPEVSTAPMPSPTSSPVVTEKANTFTPIVLNDTTALSRKTINWSWLYSPKSNATLLSKYHGYAFGDTSKKIIYLTFDEGYENGYTSSILDILKTNDVKAAFFVTETYVTGSFNGVKDVELLKRMMNEGHIIGNHSVHHNSMPSILDETAFDFEILDNERTLDSIPGLKMSKFFRPPMGDFSELSLYYTQKLGYRSIFFSLAYKDYDPNDQPDPETAKANLLKQTKPGMICLLHAVSKTNATILDSLIKTWKSQGYEFSTLNELK